MLQATCKALREVIEYTLALGNYMNGTSTKGGACGFQRGGETGDPPTADC